MLTSIGEISNNISIVISEENSNRKITMATKLIDIYCKDCKAGDVLVYRVYGDHDEDEEGEYALIPRELIKENYHDALFFNKDDIRDNNILLSTPIAISLGGATMMSIDEDDQPWSGDVYTGLYNTNFCWSTNLDSIDTNNANEFNKHWISELDGRTNTDKILWVINSNTDTTVCINCSNSDEAVSILNAVVELLNDDNITNNGIYYIEGNKLYISNLVYKAFLYEVIENGNYTITTNTLNAAFSIALNLTGVSDKFITNEDLLWKEEASKQNKFVLSSSNTESIKVEYRYKKIPLDSNDTNTLGDIYCAYPATTYINSKPTYSESTNAFMFVNQYYTPGTNIGDWYIGSKEEMHNLMNYDVITEVNEVIEALNEKNTGRTYKTIDICENPNYLTSSQTWYNDNYCYTIYTHYRYITAIDKRVICHVRPLLNYDLFSNINTSKGETSEDIPSTGQTHWDMNEHMDHYHTQDEIDCPWEVLDWDDFEDVIEEDQTEAWDILE